MSDWIVCSKALKMAHSKHGGDSQIAAQAFWKFVLEGKIAGYLEGRVVRSVFEDGREIQTVKVISGKCSRKHLNMLSERAWRHSMGHHFQGECDYQMGRFSWKQDATPTGVSLESRIQKAFYRDLTTVWLENVCFSQQDILTAFKQQPPIGEGKWSATEVWQFYVNQCVPLGIIGRSDSYKKYKKQPDAVKISRDAFIALLVEGEASQPVDRRIVLPKRGRPKRAQ
jgi:hypothetical protein